MSKDKPSISLLNIPTFLQHLIIKDCPPSEVRLSIHARMRHWSWVLIQGDTLINRVFLDFFFVIISSLYAEVFLLIIFDVREPFTYH